MLLLFSDILLEIKVVLSPLTVLQLILEEIQIYSNLLCVYVFKVSNLFSFSLSFCAPLLCFLYVPSCTT